MALAGLRGRRRPRLRPRRARSTRARSPRWRPPRRRRAATGSSARHPRQRLRVRRHGRRGRGLLRRRRGDGAARLPAGPARHGLGAAAVSRRARPARAADGRQQRRDAVQHPVHRRARRRRLPRAQPRRRRREQARLLQRALRAAGRLRGRVRDDRARAVRGRGGRPARRPHDQGAADRRAAGRDPARVAARHAVFDFEELAAEGLHGRPRRDRRLRRHAPTCARRHAPAALRRRRELRQVLPCRIGLRRAHEMFAGGAPVDRGALEELLETLELGQPVRPRQRRCRRRSAACSHTSRRSWGSRDRVDRDRRRGDRRSRPARPCSRPSARRGGESPTLCFDDRQAPFGACRVCLVGIEGAPGPIAACTTPVPRRHGGRHARPDGAAGRRRVVELVLSELPAAAGRAHRARRRRRAFELDVGAPRWPGAQHARAPRRAPSLPRLPPRAVHLVRALRARVRRGPGHVRPDRHRPRLRGQCRRRAGRGLPRIGLRVVRRLRRHLPDRRDRRDLAARVGASQTRGEPCPTRFDSNVTTTCGYCGVGCRLEAHARDGRVASISPALDGPANNGHTCLKGRFAHQFSRHRNRLTRAADPRGAAALHAATWEEAIARIVSELTRIRDGAGGPTRSPASPPRARRTRTAT